MQIRSVTLSQLRQKLIRLYEHRKEDLAPFLVGFPMCRGSVYVLRRKCSKPSCRCARGQRHESLVLSVSVEGKTRLWTLPKDRVSDVRKKTEHYRQFRKARTRFLQRQAEILKVIDAIEQIRVQPLE